MYVELKGSKEIRLKSPSRGFSLIELLIVMAVIMVIAAIAIPNFLRSRVAANQASAVGSLRSLNTAEATYSTTYGAGFSTTLGYLGPPASGAQTDEAHAGIVDDVLSGQDGAGSGAMTSTKSGYQFTYSPGTAANGMITSYIIVADPISRGYTGNNSYFIDESGVVRQNTSTQASVADSPLAG